MESRGRGHTDVGQQRENNEDTFFADDDLGLYVVCDGAGGAAAGEEASRTAAESVARYFRDKRLLLAQVRAGEESFEELPPLVVDAVQAASAEVFGRASVSHAQSGMCTTMTLLLCAGTKAIMGQVGDSRLYLVRGREVHQLSNDHTLAAELVRMRVIDEHEARRHPGRNSLTRAVGLQQGVQVDTLTLDVQPGDRFVLCSDGLTRYLDEEPRPDKLLRGGGGDLPQDLVNFANRAGGKDNVTVVAVEMEESGDGALERSETADAVRQLEALSKVVLFDELDLARLTRVYNRCEVWNCDPGDVVVGEGAPCERLWIVVRGRVTVAGSGAAPMVLSAGEFAGLRALIDETPCRAELRAETSAQLLALPRPSFLRLIRRRPWLGLSVLSRLNRYLFEQGDLATRAGGAPAREPWRI